MSGDDASAVADRSGQRIDKWLWFARVVKTRTHAARLVSDGKIRLNRVRIDKPAHTVKPGDVVTASVGRHVRVLKVLAPGVRRGPACEAGLLYEELTVATDAPIPAARAAAGAGIRPAGSGRPTKRDRRELARLKGRSP